MPDKLQTRETMLMANIVQGVTAEDREAAAKQVSGSMEWWCEAPIRQGEADNHKLVQAFRDHRLSSTAALEAEIASLKQRLESAERVMEQALSCTPAIVHAGPFTAAITYDCGDPWEILRTFLQEQEKQNG